MSGTGAPGSSSVEGRWLRSRRPFALRTFDLSWGPSLAQPLSSLMALGVLAIAYARARRWRLTPNRRRQQALKEAKPAIASFARDRLEPVSVDDRTGLCQRRQFPPGPNRGAGWRRLSEATSPITPCQPTRRRSEHSAITWLTSGDVRCRDAAITWQRIKRIADDWLPKPKVLHPWPQQRFAVRYSR